MARKKVSKPFVVNQDGEEATPTERELVEGSVESRATARDIMAKKLAAAAVHNPTASEVELGKAIGLSGHDIASRVDALTTTQEYKKHLTDFQAMGAEFMVEGTQIMRDIMVDKEARPADRIGAMKAVTDPIARMESGNKIMIIHGDLRMEMHVTPKDWIIKMLPDGTQMPMHIPTMNELQSVVNMAPDCQKHGCSKIGWEKNFQRGLSRTGYDTLVEESNDEDNRSDSLT